MVITLAVAPTTASAGSLSVKLLLWVESIPTPLPLVNVGTYKLDIFPETGSRVHKLATTRAGCAPA